MPSALIQIPVNTKKPTQTLSSQPTARQGRVLRRPKCQGRGWVTSLAKTSAAPISARSWKSRDPICTPGGGSEILAPAAAAIPPITVAPNSVAVNPAIRASGAVHGGQAGGDGRAPSGSSGGFGGGPGGGWAAGWTAAIEVRLRGQLDQVVERSDAAHAGGSRSVPARHEDGLDPRRPRSRHVLARRVADVDG